MKKTCFDHFYQLISKLLHIYINKSKFILLFLQKTWILRIFNIIDSYLKRKIVDIDHHCGYTIPF